MNEYILNGMAKAFFACAYADQFDEADQSLQSEIMDQLPKEIDPSALSAARTLYMDFESSFKNEDITLDGAWVWVHGIDRMPGYTDEEKSENFGHYAAMQAMGHGVGLFDYCSGVISDKVPTVEFGSYSLEKDYVEEVDND